MSNFHEFLRSINDLSQLGHPSSQKKVRSLLDLSSGIDEEKALILWGRSHGFDLTESLRKEEIVILPEGGEGISYIFPEDQCVYLQRPQSPSIDPLSEQSQVFMDLCKDITPSLATRCLGLLSEFRVSGNEPFRYRLVLKALALSSKRADEDLRSRLVEHNIWDIPSKEQRSLLCSLEQLIDTYEKRILTLKILGESSAMDSELSHLCQDWTRFLSFLSVKLDYKNLPEVDTTKLLPYIQGEPNTTYLFEVRSSSQEPLREDQIFSHPLLKDLLSVVVEGKDLRITSKCRDLVFDVIRPLHTNCDLSLLNETTEPIS